MTLRERERAAAWARDGLFVVPRLFGDAWIADLAGACDHALEKVRLASRETGRTTTNISPLLYPEHFDDRPDALRRLTELPSSPAVLALVADLGAPGEGALVLRDVQYFHEPSRDHDGPWHRDGAALPGESRRPTVLRFRVALAPDDHLEVVLGSHARLDTAEEREVLEGSSRNGAFPSTAYRVALRPGDVCGFDASGIHRARYRAGASRKTLDVVFGFGVRRRSFDPALLELGRKSVLGP